jgi:hypothetical protein
MSRLRYYPIKQSQPDKPHAAHANAQVSNPVVDANESFSDKRESF